MPIRPFHRHADRPAPAWIRESIRALLALALYLFFSIGGWSQALGYSYWRVVTGLNRPLIAWTQHFRGLPNPVDQIPGNQHTHLALVLALFLVSWRMPLKNRCRYFGTLAGIAILQDLVVANLSLRMHEAKALLAERGWVVLLPWEYNTIQVLWYLVYALPLQGAPFLLFLITASWNSGVKPADLLRKAHPTNETESPSLAGRAARSRSGRRVARWTAGAGVLAGIVLITAHWLWARARESDALHLRTHVLLGNLRAQEGRMAEAETEYRHAVDSGTIEGEGWLGLAQCRAEAGDRAAAIEILQEAARVVQDSKSRDRIQAELEALGSSDPYRLPPIVSAQPPTTP